MRAFAVYILAAVLLACCACAANFRVYANGSSFEPASTVVLSESAAAPAGLTEVANASYTASFAADGWNYFKVTPARSFFAPGENADSNLAQAYYYAGFVEGFVTAGPMSGYVAYKNVTSPNANVSKWIADHIQYMKAQVSANALLSVNRSAFWTQTGALLQQLQGIADGYSAAMGAGSMTFEQIFMYNFRYEIGDIVTATSPPSPVQEVAPKNIHCSALIKVTSDDIFMSQITWDNFSGMWERFFKVYDFQTTVQLSGYPGQIHSGDDWYQMSTGLISQETTNEYYNNSLARDFIKPNSVSEFLRVMIANFLATSGSEWVMLFGTNHSGTYCNQYMVLDTKQYTAGQTGAALLDNLLWVIEEIPGNVTMADVTPVLRSTSYWASYNLPYFPNIRAVSGFDEMEAKYGDFFSHANYTRALIFRRNQSLVTDLASMQALMQYNNWEQDPLGVFQNCSYCNPTHTPINGIAARLDKVPINATLPTDPQYRAFFKRNPFGATDAKVTSASMLADGMKATLFCGPTPQQGVFDWSEFAAQKPPLAPQSFQFSWQTLSSTPPPSGSPSSGLSRSAVVGLAVGIPLGVIAIAIIAKIVMGKKDDGAEYSRV